MKKLFILFLFLVASTACERKTSLFSEIPTEVVALAAYSHNDPNYQPVADSLQLRFSKLLRLLRINVVSAACAPRPEAKLALENERMIIQLDMQDSCAHATPELFDVDISVSPVHPDVFQLIIEEKDFETNLPGKILLNRRIDVRELPGL